METIQRSDNLEESQSILTISSLVRSSDERIYSCIGRNEVENIVGSVTTACASLTVNGTSLHPFLITQLKCLL